MNRVVVITGGTKGLGREIALAFARSGYFVVALYASDVEAADRLEKILKDTGAGGCVLRHDVTLGDDSTWHRPEILKAESLTLIHNACPAFSPKPMHQLIWQDFQSNLDVAVKGAWSCSQALIKPMLQKGGGTIVNILTSALEGLPPKGFAAYLSAKHALRGFTLSLAAEYAPRGVRVFSVSPGFMETPLTRRWDYRLRDAIRAASTRITNPASAAARIVELTGTAELPGQGEDYLV